MLTIKNLYLELVSAWRPLSGSPFFSFVSAWRPLSGSPFFSFVWVGISNCSMLKAALFKPGDWDLCSLLIPSAQTSFVETFFLFNKKLVHYGKVYLTNELEKMILSLMILWAFLLWLSIYGLQYIRICIGFTKKTTRSIGIRAFSTSLSVIWMFSFPNL